MDEIIDRLLDDLRAQSPLLHWHKERDGIARYRIVASATINGQLFRYICRINTFRFEEIYSVMFDQISTSVPQMLAQAIFEWRPTDG